MTIIDTDVLIDFLAGEEDVKDHMSGNLNSDSLSTTIINHYELYKGIDSDKQDGSISNLLAKLDLCQLDRESIKNAAKIFQKLKKSGNRIPESDILIAGIAISKNEKLITRDKHFKSVAGLKVEII